MSQISFDTNENKLTPYYLRWIHGLNPKVAPINLSTNTDCIIFYAVANCGVVYNWNKHEMKILQGHSNNVMCIGADASGKWLVTADTGPDNIVTIWDAKLTPCRTIFSPHGNWKLCKVALSLDAKYLLTVAWHETVMLRWWIWSFGLEVAHAELILDTVDHTIKVKFNPTNSEQFFLMSVHDVWIGESKKIIIDMKDRVPGGSDHYYALRVLKLVTPSQDPTMYRSFEFLPTTSQVMTVKCFGVVVIFGYTMEINYNADSSIIDNMKFVKAFKLDTCRITVVKFVENKMEWSNEIAMQFLEFYRLQPCIWNPKIPSYRNKKSQSDAWYEIKHNLGGHFSVIELKKKKDSMMAAYRFYRNKIKKSEISDPKNVYHPPWFAYEFMDSFLKNVYKCIVNSEEDQTDRDSIEFIDESRNEKVGVIKDEEDEDHEDFSEDPDTNLGPHNTVAMKQVEECSSPEPLQNIATNFKNHVDNDGDTDVLNEEEVYLPNHKRHSSSQNTSTSCMRRQPIPPQILEAKKQMDQAFNIIKTISQQHREEVDECSIYGNLIASKMRKLPEKRRDLMMIKIIKLLNNQYKEHNRRNSISSMDS